MTESDTPRERTYTWEDPAIRTRPSLQGLTGLEILEAGMKGEVPSAPILATIGASIESVAEGRITFVLEPAEYHYNPLGSVHGGVYCTLLDSACGCAVHSTLPAGVGYTSLDLDVKFLRPMTIETGPVRCEGIVVQSGRRTALARATITDSRSKLLAEGTSTCMIFR